MSQSRHAWPFGQVRLELASPAALAIAEADLSRYGFDQALVRELKRYLLVRKVAGRPITMQSKAVDALWHAFILDTARYRKFCDEVFGEYLDHVSDHFPLDSAFPGLYEEMFGEPLPALWFEQSSRLVSPSRYMPDLADGNCA